MVDDMAGRQTMAIQHMLYCRFLKSVLLYFVNNVGQGRRQFLSKISRTEYGFGRMLLDINLLKRRTTNELTTGK